MTTSTGFGTATRQTINVAKSSKTKIPKVKDVLKEKADKKKLFENKLVEAAQSVALSLGGDVKRTESDLLYKILRTGKEEKPDKEQIAEDKIENKENLSNTQHFSKDLMDILSEMKVSRDSSKEELISFEDITSRTNRARMYTQPKSSNRQISSEERQNKFSRKKPNDISLSLEKFNLYIGKKLNLFGTIAPSESKIPELSTWDVLEQRDFKLAVTQPPENIFQEMIQWTDKGILWNFPINNEQGMEAENNVHFSEHVFMERHLQDWCPTKGPIRHFMELICVGLSKNAYLTVDEKITHIMWYKEYFEGKESILREVGALPEGHSFKSVSSGQEKEA